MQTLTEKRVFGSKYGTTEVFVASETGLVGVTVSADQIGEFGLAFRGPVATVAADDRGVLIGTDEDVFYNSRDTESENSRTAQSRTFSAITAEPFGETVAVGWRRQGPIAVDGEGAVAGLDGDWASDDKPDWIVLGTTDGVRAVDGELIATVSGVYRLIESEIQHVGLGDARDVAAHGTPLAATADGLFWLGNGWLSVRDGAFERVASDGHGHAHAIGPSGLLRCETNDGGSMADSEWVEVDLPVDSPVVDVAYGGGIVAAVTEDGTLCVNAGDGWRHQLLGVRGISGLAVGPGSE